MNRLDVVAREVLGIQHSVPGSKVHDAPGASIPHTPQVSPGRSVRNRSILSISPKTSATENPRPLFGAGRVATFQNSEIFCSVKYTGSPAESSFATLSTANVWLG